MNARTLGYTLRRSFARANRVENRVVESRLAQLLPQKHERLLVENTRCAEHELSNVFLVGSARIYLRQVIRRSAERRIVRDALLGRESRQHERGIEAIERLDLQLHGATPVKRAFSPQHLAFHESFVAPAQNNAHVRLLELVIDRNLQNRRQRGLGFSGIRKFVEHEKKRVIPAPLCHGGNKRKRATPVGKRP